MPLNSRFVRYMPRVAKVLLTALVDNAPHARRLVAASPVTTTDGGDRGDFTIAVDGATNSTRGVVKLAGQLGGSADAPDVRGLRVTDSSTPVMLALGEVQDGKVLARSGTGVVGVSVLPSGGGTLSGNLAMGGHKVTGLAAAASNGEAVRYEQLTSFVPAGVRAGGDPGSPVPGEVWIVGPELKYRNNTGTPATDFVERQSRINQHGGYAGLDGDGRIASGQAPVKAVYTSGGSQAINPADIGAAPGGRTITAGAGLSGGGDLNADRTLSIAAFTGLVSRDVDPASDTWGDGQIRIYPSPAIDVGTAGVLVPVHVRLPPTVDSRLTTEVVFEFSDTTTAILGNTSTSSPLDLDMMMIADRLMGDLTGGGQNNGKHLQKVHFQVRNMSTDTISSTDIGWFRLRAYAFPRGGGSSL